MKRFNCGAQKASLSFYTALPVRSLNYEVLRENATGRLKVLRRIEANISDTLSIKSMEEDLVGHACLKLVCCQSRWASIWFVNMETRLFKARLDKDPSAAKQFFREKFWPHLNFPESGGVVEPSTAFGPQYDNPSPLSPSLRLHFSKCSDVLAKRIYAPHAGYFLLNDEIMKSWLVCEFRRYLGARVEVLYNQLCAGPDERFERLAKELFVEAPSGNAPAKDALSKERLFPLCAKGILEKLRREKHLKYNDRQALCLFLKDIGVPLQDTIQFFRTHFGASLDQFNKSYLYSIRHNYGLEGRRANYTSFTCAKLMGMAADTNTFGCPFVKNAGFVRQHSDIEDIGRDAHGCCAKVGAKYAGRELEGVFASPADYYRLSEKAADAST